MQNRLVKKEILKELQKIPGIGTSLAVDLYDLEITKIQNLENKDPQELYDHLCQMRNTKLDPCVLYTFRCAVYFAREKNPDPELLKWWNWKNKVL